MNELVESTEDLANKNPDNIYLVTDVHLFKNEIFNMKHNDDERKCDTKSKMANFKKECSKLTKDDVLIFLGDISHACCNLEQHQKVKAFYKEMKVNKILIKGNHDQQPDTYYKECGFMFVVPYLTYKNIIFTHMPVIQDKNLNRTCPINDKVFDYKGRQFHKQWVSYEVYPHNIHGHIHGENKYFDTEKKGHYDVWRDNHEFLKLKNIMNKKSLNETYWCFRLRKILY